MSSLTEAKGETKRNKTRKEEEKKKNKKTKKQNKTLHCMSIECATCVYTLPPEKVEQTCWMQTSVAFSNVVHRISSMSPILYYLQGDPGSNMASTHFVDSHLNFLSHCRFWRLFLLSAFCCCLRSVVLLCSIVYAPLFTLYSILHQDSKEALGGSLHSKCVSMMQFNCS